MLFADAHSTVSSDPLPMNEHEYYKLVDMTARVVVRGKRGSIDPALAPILDRLGLSSDDWVNSATAFRQYYLKGDLRLNRVA